MSARRPLIATSVVPKRWVGLGMQSYGCRVRGAGLGVQGWGCRAGGAGLGLYLSFLTLNKFIINISPGKKTEMIGLCDIRSSSKNFNLLDKTLTIFVES